MVRPSLDADAPYVDGVVHGDGLTSLQFRRTKGAITEQTSRPSRAPTSSSSSARAARYIFSAAKYRRAVHDDARSTTSISATRSGRPRAVLAQSRRRSNAPIFRDVRIIRPAKDDFVPYRDFIGSVLEILDVQSGHRQVIHRSEQPFEAPNWTPDGSALIYNRQRPRRKAGAGCTGSISRRGSRRSSTPAPPTATTTITCCRSTARCSASAIRARRRAAARRSTPCRPAAARRSGSRTLSPSYLHSWSPDGKRADLHRRPQQRVRHLPHRRRTAAGPRSNLTNEQGAGRRAGVHARRQVHLLQLGAERDDADVADEAGRQRSGADHQRRVNNWFPHVSPDGQWIAFISFPKEVLRPTIRTTSACICG